MIALALTALEKAINAYLHLDQDSMRRLAHMKSTVIKIYITDWHFTFFILPNTDGITLIETCDRPADTTISGTLFGLFKSGCGKASNSALFKNSIDVSGNVEVGESIRDLFTQIDIDWEEHFSTIVGDIAAHKIGVGMRRTMDAAHHTKKTLCTNLKEYLQQESQQLPSPTQVEKYIESVQTLQNDVDRAEARLERLLAKRNSHR